MTNLWPNGLLYLIPVLRKYWSGIPKLHKYNLPHALLIPSNGKIGNIEHFNGIFLIATTGGSIAMTGDLENNI